MGKLILFIATLFFCSSATALDMDSSDVQGHYQQTGGGTAVSFTNSWGSFTGDAIAGGFSGSFTDAYGNTATINLAIDSAFGSVIYPGCSIHIYSESFIIRDMYAMTGRGNPYACSTLMSTLEHFVEFQAQEFGTPTLNELTSYPEGAVDEWIDYMDSNPQGWFSCGAAWAITTVTLVGGGIGLGYTVATPLMPPMVKKSLIVAFWGGGVAMMSWAGSFCI